MVALNSLLPLSMRTLALTLTLIGVAFTAQFYGDARKDPSIPTGIAATPSGNGYYLMEKRREWSVLTPNRS